MHVFETVIYLFNEINKVLSLGHCLGLGIASGPSIHKKFLKFN